MRYEQLSQSHESYDAAILIYTNSLVSLFREFQGIVMWKALYHSRMGMEDATFIQNKLFR